MRSKFLRCAAIATVGLSSWLAPMALAAGAKDPIKDPKKKPTELHADDKSMKKQTQWEDKIMGPDTKRAELEKIARARAVNEKAEKDKEKQAALEAAAPPPKAAAPAKGSNKSEVNLLSGSEDTGAKSEPSRGISPKLETEAAREAPAPVKHTDDKFIDKLLRDEDAPKKHAASANDKELENLLAGAKEKPHKKGDSIDDLLKAGDKAPAMPAPRAQQGGLPEWAKQPEIASAPPPPPVAVRAVPKKKDDSGVIHVVQGAAGNAPAIVSPPPAAPVATRPVRGKAGKGASPQQVVWSDPFAEKKAVGSTSKKETASHPAASDSGGWSDPFAEPAESRKAGSRKAAPAPMPASAPAKRRDAEKSDPGTRPGTWKDPFTKATVPVPPRAPVAMREPVKGESSKWEIAARRPAARTPSSDSRTASGWGVLKKRAR